MLYFDQPVGRVKMQTTFNERFVIQHANCYFSAGEFLTGSLEYKYRKIFVLVLGVICTL